MSHPLSLRSVSLQKFIADVSGHVVDGTLELRADMILRPTVYGGQLLAEVGTTPLYPLLKAHDSWPAADKEKKLLHSTDNGSTILQHLLMYVCYR